LLTSAGWFTIAWIDRVLDEAPQRFDRAFDRWRELYRAATRQLLEAQNALLRARRSDEQAQATSRQQEALRQRNLLLQVNTAREESDFYPYRYLASEGFLPGYNFSAANTSVGAARRGRVRRPPALPRIARIRAGQHPLPRRRQVGRW
jgi:multidrug resistance efflux pump